MPTPTIFEGINPRGTQTLIPCKDDKAQNGVIANTKLIKDTVGWSGKNKGKYINQALVGDATLGFNLVTGGSSLIAKIENNKDYVVQKKNGQGDRFRIVLFPNVPPTVVPDKSAVQLINDYTKNNYTFNSGNYNYAVFTYVSSSSPAISQDTAEAMIYDADILDPTYEPYFGSTAFPRSEQAVLGAKNLLPNNATSKTNNGVTWTVDQNGVITANGTAEDSNSTIVLITQYLLKAGSYVLSGAKSQYEFIQIYMSNSPYTEIARDTGNGAIINLATDTIVNALIAVSVGTTVNNSVYKPMLRLASDPDDTYSPYAMNNKELTDFAKHTKTILLGTNSSYTFTLPDASANGNVHACFLALMSSTGGLEVNVLAGYRIAASAGNIKTIAGAATGSFDTTTGKFTITADGPQRTLTIIANAEILE